MKSFFDTSVLIPVFFDDHIHHEASFALLQNASRTDSGCAAHSLAEIYSVVTRMAGKYRAGAEEAMLLLETLREKLSCVALNEAEYWAALKQCSEAGTVGGAMYDALIAQCALKARAEILYTWNVAHFTRLGVDIAKRVRTP